MKLYEDYCPQCPRPATKTKGFGYGPPVPSQCHQCSPATFKEIVCEHVNTQRDIEACKKDILASNRALEFYERRSKVFYDKIKEQCQPGKLRIIQLCNVSVILDGTDDKRLRISFAEHEVL